MTSSWLDFFCCTDFADIGEVIPETEVLEEVQREPEEEPEEVSEEEGGLLEPLGVPDEFADLAPGNPFNLWY